MTSIAADRSSLAIVQRKIHPPLAPVLACALALLILPGPAHVMRAEAASSPSGHRAAPVQPRVAEAPAAPASVSRDSVHIARRITIGANGIQIDGNDAARSAENE